MSLVAAIAPAAIGLFAVAAHRLARGLPGLHPIGRLTVALGVGVATFVGVTALVGRAAERFDAGLLAALVLGGLSVALVARFGGAPPAPDSGLGGGVSPGLIVSLSLVAGLYGLLSAGYQMHDEHALFGHKPIIEQMRHDLFPPHLPPIPGEEGRYHSGFDVLAAAFARGYGTSSDLGIDVWTVLLALLLSVAAVALVGDAAGERRPANAGFVAVAIHLGAGLAFVLLAGVEGRHPRCLIQYHHPSCGVELFPIPILNVFQHPVSAGVPLLFTWLLLAPRILAGSGRAAVLGLAMMPGFAYSQVVYFVFGLLSAGTAAVFLRVRNQLGAPTRRGAALFVGVAALGLLLAVLAGGMFAPAKFIEPGLLGFRRTPGYPPGEGPLGVLWHYLVNLGVGFVLFPWFVLRIWRGAPFAITALVAFAAGGMLVPQLFAYARSWDIVKFPSAAAFALTMLVAMLVDRPLAGAPSGSVGSADPLRALARSWLRRGLRGLLIGSGVLASIFLLFPLPGELRLYDTGHWRGDEYVRRTIDWWWQNGYRREELIYAQDNIAKELSVFGGLSVVAEDFDFYALGVRTDWIERQRRLSERVKRELDPEALRELGVRWLVFSGDEVNNLGPVARERLANLPVWLEVAATFEADHELRRRRIYRVRE